jgi:hypothetical protein
VPGAGNQPVDATVMFRLDPIRVWCLTEEVKGLTTGDTEEHGGSQRIIRTPLAALKRKPVTFGYFRRLDGTFVG